MSAELYKEVADKTQQPRYLNFLFLKWKSWSY